MATKKCECGTVLNFRFAPCDYICPYCGKSYSEHEINLLYGESDY